MCTKTDKLYPRCNMYPYCSDCIHRRRHLWGDRCKNNVSVKTCRNQERLCGEHAAWFSPTFVSLAQTRRKDRSSILIENEIGHDMITNRTTSHRTRH